jgi:hypothetical protein
VLDIDPSVGPFEGVDVSTLSDKQVRARLEAWRVARRVWERERDGRAGPGTPVLPEG